MPLKAKKRAMEGGLSSFCVVGVNHHNTPLQVREKLARLGSSTEDFLNKIAFRLGIRSLVLISTCNRFEVVAFGEGASRALKNELFELLGEEKSAQKEFVFVQEGEEAIRHVFEVASGLDSLVLGETQILGQVKAGYEISSKNRLVGKELHRLFQCAFKLAKRVRSQTALSSGGVSVSYVAVKLAEQIFGSLEKCSVLIAGSGRMAELAGIHLKTLGAKNIVVCNRTVQKACKLADALGGKAAPLSELTRLSRDADVIIGSLTIDRPILCASHLRTLKRDRPLFLIDLGVPRNFPADLDTLDDIYLYNIDDLQKIADVNKASREDAAKNAAVMLDYGVLQFLDWSEKVAEEPFLLDFRSRIREGAVQEIRKGLKVTGLGIESDLSEDLSQKIANRIVERLSVELQELLPGRTITRSLKNEDIDADLFSNLFLDQLKRVG